MKGSNFAAGLLLICLTMAAWAASTATLTGRVMDANGGRIAGAQVQITDIAYFRNEAMDAADFFDKIGGLPKRKLRQNDFGGVLGGPVQLPRKWFGPLGYDGCDKTFFFFSSARQQIAPQRAQGQPVNEFDASRGSRVGLGSPSMMKQSDAGKRHGYAIFITRGDYLRVAI